jgi:hypothetical protein
MSSYEKTQIIDPEKQSLTPEITKEEKFSCSRICFISLLIIALVSVWLIVLYAIIWSPDIDEYDGDARLEAKLIGFRNSHHKKKTCENILDFRPDTYGCCEIVDEYNVSYDISYARGLKKDEEGSNCPSYHNILELSSNYLEEFESYFRGSFAKSGEKKCIKSGVTLPFKECPSTSYIISLYNNFYPNPYEGFYLFNIICILGLCVLFNCDCDKRGRY